MYSEAVDHTKNILIFVIILSRFVSDQKMKILKHLRRALTFPPFFLDFDEGQLGWRKTILFLNVVQFGSISNWNTKWKAIYPLRKTLCKKCILSLSLYHGSFSLIQKVKGVLMFDSYNQTIDCAHSFNLAPLCTMFQNLHNRFWKT